MKEISPTVPILIMLSCTLFLPAIPSDSQGEHRNHAFSEASPDPGKSLTDQAKRLFDAGKFAEALAVYQQAADIATSLDDEPQLSLICWEIGNTYYALGDYSKASDSYRKSLGLAEKGGNRGLIAQLHKALGTLHYTTGDYMKGLQEYKASLKLGEELQNPKIRSAAMLGIGLVHYSRGDYVEALRNLQASLSIERDLHDDAGVARALLNIGIIHHKQGDYYQALAHYQKSFNLVSKFGNRGWLIKVMYDIGLARQQLGNYARALRNYQRALELAEQSGDKLSISKGLILLGYLRYQQHRLPEALVYYQKALAIAEDSGNKTHAALALTDVSEISRSLGHFEEALRSADRADLLAQEIGSLERLWETYTIRGKIHKALNEPIKAINSFDQAINVIEQLRGQVAGREREQQRFFEDKVFPYQAMVELMLGQNQTPKALSYGERAKSRVLLDTMNRNSGTGITPVMDGKEREEDRRLSKRLVSLNRQFYAESLQQKPEPVTMSRLEAEVQSVRLEYEAFQVGVSASHPKLKLSKSDSRVFSLDDATELIGATQAALIEYVVSRDKTFLFVITKDRDGQPSIRSYRIPITEKELTALARGFRIQLAEYAPNFRGAAQQLYQLLLKPAEQQLKRAGALCIVPDGILWELPFQALQPDQNQYLLERYELFYAPSLAALREMRKVARSSFRSPETLTAVAFASARSALDKPKSNEFASLALPEAEQEVLALAELYGPSRSRIYTRAAASEREAKNQMANYQVVHFATHGALNDRNPLYSGLMLAAGATRSEDGILQAWEIMNLKLKADLAVLSACETARGRVGKGEGLIGMGWAFFVAGCPSTVVSQWRVDSFATKELMIEFHRQLTVRGRPRVSKAQALRNAALLIRNTTLLEHPYHWAGFVLVGSDQ